MEEDPVIRPLLLGGRVITTRWQRMEMERLKRYRERLVWYKQKLVLLKETPGAERLTSHTDCMIDCNHDDCTRSVFNPYAHFLKVKTPDQLHVYLRSKELYSMWCS